ncbi:hypothetical protein Hypma_006923 [Hypsizygus marmoreus]|uniref:Uncharacterized protein n=1 Tax=Hypsizygus marmoreus TaxID=39966 RepID=A0A369JX25_HYPMA|nr:hypothetical protein Hypma_006923 [Hypsizygus marmoreus]
MAPRFANPHFLPDDTTLVSRKRIYSYDSDVSDADEVQKPSNPNQELVGALNHLIHKSLEVPDQHQTHGRSKKRRKTEKEPEICTSEEEDLISFRLVANLPHPISLQPRPPPPPITREPECEDNEVQGLLRMEHAQSVAIDPARIINESKTLSIPRFGETRKLQRLRVTLPPSPPPMLIVERDQLPRATRPPVPPFQLNRHPYGPRNSDLTDHLSSKSMHCPLVRIDRPPSNTVEVENKRKRHRRGKLFQKERPPPSFWRPNPPCSGKSLGYAMGYPCSIEALENGTDERSGYQRDTMRTCTYFTV